MHGDVSYKNRVDRSRADGCRGSRSETGPSFDDGDIRLKIGGIFVIIFQRNVFLSASAKASRQERLE